MQGFTVKLTPLSSFSLLFLFSIFEDNLPLPLSDCAQNDYIAFWFSAVFNWMDWLLGYRFIE